MKFMKQIKDSKCRAAPVRLRFTDQSSIIEESFIDSQKIPLRTQLQPINYYKNVKKNESLLIS